MSRYVICPGFTRCGTSTLFNLLIQHPEVCRPYSKEINYFLLDYKKDIEFYKKKLGIQDSCNLAVDFSPAYAVDDSIPERIESLSGDDVKFIFMVREPVRRLKSHYFMEKRLLHENLSWDDSFNRNIEDRQSRSLEIYGHPHGFNYIKSSLYGEAIKNYIDRFPVANIKIIVLEEFIVDMTSSIRDVCCFLGIDPDFDFDLNVNTNPTIIASRHIGIDKLSNKVKSLPYIRKRNWRAGFIKKIAGRLKRKIGNYKAIDYYKEISISDDVKGIIAEDTKLLEKITGRNFDVWKKRK